MTAPKETAAVEARDPLVVARELLQCALSWEPGVRLLGNVTARDIAALAARAIITCPKCGAEAWANIDCDLCLFCSELLQEPRR